MCGIAGIFNTTGHPVSSDTLKDMADELNHRGPDDEGYFHHKNIGLGHKRLSILDTTFRGKQPMTSKNNEWIVVFNGCIYNFKDIRQELISTGHHFNSNSDTEVICEALSEYGPEIFEKFDGMFAIGAYNKKTETLYLSRDRFGIKPLYYWYNGATLLFASEIKSFRKHPDFKVELDLNSLNEYFTFQNQFTYNTLFKNVYMLPQANTIKIDKHTRKIQHNSWWDYDFSKPDDSMSFFDAKEETKRLLKQAVKKQIVSDVPVGSYLSGGMDSGSITSIASEHIDRLATFTCGFDMSEVTGVEANYDERKDAELMANAFKTQHYERVINAGDLSWSLPRVVNHIEDLRVGMSYPNFYISNLASKFVKVALQGTGGDELFGGYPWRYYRIFKSVDRQEFFDEYYNFWQRLVPEENKVSLFSKSVMNKINIDDPRKIFERVFLFNEKLKYDTPEEHIQNSLYFEIKTFLPGLLLVGDKLAMANSLEERFPFLDNELVDFAQKIPVRHKLANLENYKKIDENAFRKRIKAYQDYNDGKNVLRQSMMDLIPEKIINRKKQGFSAPDESWYRGENAKYIKELLLTKENASSEFINQDFMRNIINEHINMKKNHRLLIWSFMNFEWWCRIFLNNENF